jgi:hypothetical protein
MRRTAAGPEMRKSEGCDAVISRFLSLCVEQDMVLFGREAFCLHVPPKPWYLSGYIMPYPKRPS